MNIVADRSIPFVKTLFSTIGKLTLLDGRRITSSDLLDADVLVIRTVTSVNRELLAGTRVRLVATATSGTDHIDTDYLRQSGIGLVHAPGCNARSVAEYVLSCLLVLAEQRQMDLSEKTVGIIGCGHVGSTLKQMLEALGIRYLLNDPPLQQRGSGTSFLPLEEILGADIISLHVPLEKSGPFPTWHLLDSKRLARVNKDVILINTSRGGVIDEAALSDFIDESPQASVVLDVWENEPAINLALLQKVVIATPHIAGYSADSKLSGTLSIYRQTCRFFAVQVNELITPPLPAPEPDRIFISAYTGAQDAVQMAVLASYDVRTDSGALRQIVNVRQPERETWFADLRNNYPVRREYPAMTVVVTDQSVLSEQLVKLGFNVEQKMGLPNPAMNRIRLGFLASHQGTNMQSIIDACKQGRLQAMPAAVISNNGASGALDRASTEGIPAYHISAKNYPDPDALDIAMRDILIRHQIDLVVLAGFMKKIGPKTLAAFTGRIINIHPALLPRHGGKGMYGKNVHEQVLAAGDRETGVTVHVVTDDYDTGPILSRETVPVLAGDTPDTLGQRVLEVEHRVYVETIAKIITGEIRIS